MRHFVPQNQTEEVDLGRIFRTLWLGNLWIALMALAGAVGGSVYAWGIATPLYSASADVTFEHRRDRLVDPNGLFGVLSGDPSVLNTEIEVLRSRFMIGRLVEKLDLTEDPEFNSDLRGPPSWFSPAALLGGSRTEISPAQRLETTTESVLKVISITNLRQSYIFRIRVTTQDPEKSVLMANTLAGLYILDQLEQKFEASRRASEWMSERAAGLKEELQADVAAVENFNATSSVIGAQQLEALNRQLKDLRAWLGKAQEDATRAEALLAQAREAGAREDYAALAEVTGDNALQALMRRGAGEIQQADRAAALVAELEAAAARARDQAGVYDGSIRRLADQIAAQSRELAELQELQREADASRLIYENFLERMKESVLHQGLHQADSRVLSQAVNPRRPSAPRRAMIVILSTILGAFAGVALVLGWEIAQDTVRKAEDLEQITGLTVMGQIPEVPVSRQNNPVEYLLDKPNSAAAEAMRDLRVSTLLSDIDKPPQVIMITSSVPGEGKTKQSLALAQNLAGLGAKILVIEGDIRRRNFAEYIEIKNKRGILSVVSGRTTLQETAFYSETLDGDVLVGSRCQASAADLFASQGFAQLIEAARAAYDYVVIDTPPVLVVPDARVIGQHCDAILYAVKWDSTSARQVREGLKSFESANLKVTGTFLTQINISKLMSYGLGDGYGAYGTYGRGYYDN